MHSLLILVKQPMPDRDLALRLWNERRADGAWKWTADQIAWRSGFANGDSLRATVSRWRRLGDTSFAKRGWQADKLHRIAAMLRQGLTQTVIAERLGITLNNVRQQASRARRRGLAPPTTWGKAA